MGTRGQSNHERTFYEECFQTITSLLRRCGTKWSLLLKLVSYIIVSVIVLGNNSISWYLRFTLIAFVGLALLTSVSTAFQLRLQFLWRIVAYYAVIGITSLFVTIAALPWPGDVTNYKVAWKIFWFMSRPFNIEFDVRGAELLDSVTGPMVLVANHQSALDLLAMTEVWPSRCVPLIKKELMFAGTFGLAAKLLGSLFVERFHTQTAMKQLEHALRYIADKQTKIWIFPEGTRNANGSMLPFKKGAFHLAVQAQISLLPIVISSFNCFYNKRDFKFLSGGCVIVSVLPPISTCGLEDKDVHDLAVSVREKMLAEFNSISSEAALKMAEKGFA